MKEASDPVRCRAADVFDSGLETRPSADSFVALYQKAGAESFGLTLEEFAQILREVSARYLGAGLDSRDGSGRKAISPAEASAFYASLRLEELALARACAKGRDRAWEIFLDRYREKLRDAARSIAREESLARELADSLYADLLGMGKDGGPRNSKLNSYTGRGSLEGWLRTVLAQAYVDRYRSQRRLVSLEEQAEAGVQFRAREEDRAPLPDPRLEAAADEALSALPAEDRFILASYYLDGRTLAQIARTLAVHESTISRKIEKITGSLRKRIVEGLRGQGMSRAQAQEALEADVRDLSLDVRGRLTETTSQEKGGKSVP